MVQYIKTHIFYVTLIAAGLFLGHVWLAEHDAQQLADQQVKISEARVESLQNQINVNQQLANSTIAELKKRAAVVKTIPQAIAAIPDVSTLPLNTRALPESPNQVAVDALPLYQTLNQCKQDTVELGACKANAKLMTDQLIEKDTEIAALKRKPSFWHRLKSTTKTIGIGAIIGAVGVGVLLK